MKLRRWLPAGAGLAAFVLFFGRALSPDVFLFRRDAFRLYLPLETFIRGELSAHRLPTWYPLDGLGVSLPGSSVAGLLHPRHLLLLWLSPDQALKWATLGAIALAGVGTWLLARQFGASPPGRMLAALGYGLSGYLLSMSDNAPYVLSAATLPWVALAAERLGRKPLARRAALLGLALALGAWSGDVQGALLQALLAAGLVLRRGFRIDRLRGLALAGGLELCWMAPLIPAIAAVSRQSGRLGGLDATMAMKWSLSPVRLFELAFGAPWPAAFLGDLSQDFSPRYLSGGTQGLWTISAFVGTALVVLAALALAQAGLRGSRLAMAITAGLGLWLALGSHAGLYGLLYRDLPLWSAFRYPTKLLPFFNLGTCVLAALGLRALRGRRVTAGLTLLGLGLLAGAAAIHGGAVVRALTALDPNHGAPSAAFVDGTVQAARAALALSAVVVLGLALAAWRRGGWIWLVPALALLQSAPLSGWVMRVQSTSWLARSSPFAAQARARQGAGRICQEVENSYHFDEPPQENADEVTEGCDIDALAPDYAGRDGVAALPGYIPGFPGSLEPLCRHHPCGTACARLLGSALGVIDGARFAFLQDGGAGLEELARMKNPALVLFNDPAARPFAEPVAVHFVASEATQSARLAETPAHPIAAVTLQGTGADQPAAAGTIQVTRPRPDTLQGRVHLAAPSWVVLREACAWGWRAALDGAPIALERADGIFCAAHLPAGDHALMLHYRPPGWPWSWGLYVLAWLAAGALCWPMRRGGA